MLFVNDKAVFVRDEYVLLPDRSNTIVCNNTHADYIRSEPYSFKISIPPVVNKYRREDGVITSVFVLLCLVNCSPI